MKIDCFLITHLCKHQTCDVSIARAAGCVGFRVVYKNLVIYIRNEFVTFMIIGGGYCSSFYGIIPQGVAVSQERSSPAFTLGLVLLMS